LLVGKRLKPAPRLSYKNLPEPVFGKPLMKKFPMGWESHEILGALFWEWKKGMGISQAFPALRKPF
jgi:hypothetical protein